MFIIRSFSRKKSADLKSKFNFCILATENMLLLLSIIVFHNVILDEKFDTVIKDKNPKCACVGGTIIGNVSWHN